MTPDGLILSYHRIASAAPDPWGMRVSPELFFEQMATVARIGTPVSLAEFIRPRSDRALGERKIAVTFDDGYLDNLEQALPVLREFRIPATVFVSTGYTGEPFFWWEALEHALLRPRSLPPEFAFEHGGKQYAWSLAEAATYSPDDYEADCNAMKWRGYPGTRVRFYFEVFDALWAIPHAPRLELVADIMCWAGLDQTSLADARPMTAGELTMLASDGLIEIGGHSVNHPPLDQLSRDRQIEEIGGGRAFLEKLLGRKIASFAYPHGKYNAATLEILAGLDFECACTTEQKAVTRAENAMLLPRIVIRNWNRADFTAKLEKFFFT